MARALGSAPPRLCYCFAQLPCSKPLVNPPAQPHRPCTPRRHQKFMWPGWALVSQSSTHYTCCSLRPECLPRPPNRSCGQLLFILGRPSTGTPSQGSLASLQKGTLCPHTDASTPQSGGLLCPALEVLGHQTQVPWGPRHCWPRTAHRASCS